MVPASARCCSAASHHTLDEHVRRGQTLATLEYNYVLHDAVHLVNQRWLYLVPMLATKRASLRGRPRPPPGRVIWPRTRSRRSSRRCRSCRRWSRPTWLPRRRGSNRSAPQKLLAMHTAEITESDLVRRPIVSPIDGAIEAVTFTHGQLKYENDKLFTILDLSRVWVEARFPEEMAARRPPEPDAFRVPGVPGGAVRRSARARRQFARSAKPERSRRSSKCRIPDRLLRVGMRLSAQPPAGRGDQHRHAGRRSVRPSATARR